MGDRLKPLIDLYGDLMQLLIHILRLSFLGLAHLGTNALQVLLQNVKGSYLLETSTHNDDQNR